nr:MAG TPA: hypothetical protein [Caudoviricetes sp.]
MGFAVRFHNWLLYFLLLQSFCQTLFGLIQILF